MGEFQALLHKYLAVVVLLLVFACHEVVLTHGRQIKATNHHSSLDKHTNINGNAVPALAHRIVEDTRPTNPRHSPGVGNYSLNQYSVKSEDSNTDYTNAFRPTTPGNSPRIGHRKFGEDDKSTEAKVVVQSPDVDYSLTDTEPGHSPGVGHHKKFGEDDKDIKVKVVVQSPDVKHNSVTFEGSKAESKPTKPGHSPGVGHATKINGELPHVQNQSAN